jgi:hypothetical protein
MAAATYKLKIAPGISDLIVTSTGSFRIRPGENVEIDLAEPDQDAAFDESKYDVEGVEPPNHFPFPS